MNTTATLPCPPATGLLSGRRWLQAGALILAWAASDALATALHWPVPGSLAGMGALWLLLAQGVLPMSWIEQGADGLLDHLMLFFVPAMLALVDHPEFLSMLGVKLLAAVVIGTLIVMSGTALVVELGFRLGESRRLSDER